MCEGESEDENWKKEGGGIGEKEVIEECVCVVLLHREVVERKYCGGKRGSEGGHEREERTEHGEAHMGGEL